MWCIVLEFVFDNCLVIFISKFICEYNLLEWMMVGSDLLVIKINDFLNDLSFEQVVMVSIKIDRIRVIKLILMILVKE